MNNFITEYKVKLIDKKLSNSTIESYIRDVLSYKAYFFDLYCTENFYYDTKIDDIYNFIEQLKKDNKSEATILRKICSLNNFFEFLCEKKIIKENFIKKIKLEKKEKKLPEILNNEEIDIILKMPNEHTKKGLRDKAMLELLYATGIRVSEIINLDTENIQIKQKIVRCASDKGDRAVPIHNYALTILKLYLSDVRPKLVTNKSECALFVNMNGERLSRQGFWKIIKYYVKEAKFSKTVTPHTLRHSFAVHLLENGAKIKDVQEMLGHADVSSMHIYSKAIKNKHADAYLKYHPRAK